MLAKKNIGNGAKKSAQHTNEYANAGTNAMTDAITVDVDGGGGGAVNASSRPEPDWFLPDLKEGSLIAVKMLRAYASPKTRENFLREIEIVMKEMTN